MIWIAVASAAGLLGYAARILGLRGLVEHRGKVDVSVASILIWYSTVNPSATGMIVSLVGGASATLMLEAMAWSWNWQAKRGYLKPLKSRKQRAGIDLQGTKEYVSKSLSELASKID